METKTIALPEGTRVTVDGSMVTVKGAKGEEQLQLRNVKVAVEGNSLQLTAGARGKKGKKDLGSIAAHLRNLLSGVTKGHTYTLKICSGHFPMSVSVEKGEVVVKNFLGEKVSRRTKLKTGVTVKVSGQDITVESSSKEVAGNMAGALEKLTRRPNYDKRVFQDGIYITNKSGKAIA